MTLARDFPFVVINRLFHRVYRKQQLQFWSHVGYNPNIAVPRRYHEKMLWRKLFDRNPLFTVFCDKLATKEFIRGRAPELRVPETLWVGTNVEDIPASLLQRPLVIKCNHSSSSNWFWRPGISNLEVISNESTKHLAQVYGADTYETDYRDVPRVLFAEELVEGFETDGVVDIMVRAADGKAIIASLITQNKTDHMKLGYFELDGSRAGFDKPSARTADRSLGYEPLRDDFTVPGSFAEAVSYAEKLSRGVDYARFDFLCGPRGLYAGEITVYPAAGLTPATGATMSSAETRVNDRWDLRKSWFLSTPREGWRRFYAGMLSKEFERGAVR
ncbi:MAG: ATP-grasp fold amidoligase family protein [Candidatus Binatia bacterium]